MLDLDELLVALAMTRCARDRLARQLPDHFVQDTPEQMALLQRMNMVLIAPINLGTLAVLSVVLPIDIAVLFELERHCRGIAEATTPICLFCGTMDRATCAHASAPYCAWTAPPALNGAPA